MCVHRSRLENIMSHLERASSWFFFFWEGWGCGGWYIGMAAVPEADVLSVIFFLFSPFVGGCNGAKCTDSEAAEGFL